MTKAITTWLAAIAACAMFACGDDGMVGESSTESDTDGTEPTLFSGENADEEPRTADEREQLASANGAVARAISHNHPEPHTLTIPALDLQSGRKVVHHLSLGGGAHGELHTHTVELSALQLSTLRDGAELTVESGVGGARGAHTHTITITRR